MGFQEIRFFVLQISVDVHRYWRLDQKEQTTETCFKLINIAIENMTIEIASFPIEKKYLLIKITIHRSSNSHGFPPGFCWDLALAKAQSEAANPAASLLAKQPWPSKSGGGQLLGWRCWQNHRGKHGVSNG